MINRSRFHHRPRVTLSSPSPEALELPGAVESAHMQHPDFRVGGRIFATLGAPGPEWGMVQLTPEEQEIFVAIDPNGFRPVPGGWGLKGATNVRLDAAKTSVVRDALAAAWRRRASPAPSKPRKAARRRAGKPRSR